MGEADGPTNLGRRLAASFLFRQTVEIAGKHVKSTDIEFKDGRPITMARLANLGLRISSRSKPPIQPANCAKGCTVISMKAEGSWEIGMRSFC
jgi:hypothetical protein